MEIKLFINSLLCCKNLTFFVIFMFGVDVSVFLSVFSAYFTNFKCLTIRGQVITKFNYAHKSNIIRHIRLVETGLENTALETFLYNLSMTSLRVKKYCQQWDVTSHHGLLLIPIRSFTSKYLECNKVVHYFVFRNQNKWFGYLEGWVRKKNKSNKVNGKNLFFVPHYFSKLNQGPLTTL